jgi:AAA family ATPase
VVIDDIEVLCPSRQASGASETQKRLVTCLLTLMDGVEPLHSDVELSSSRVFVIAATSKPNSLDSALRRPGRFDVELEVPAPTAQQREAILTAILDTMGCPVVTDAGGDKSAGITGRDVSEVAATAHGLVGSDILQLCKYAATCAHRRLLTARQKAPVGSKDDSASALADQLSSLTMSSSGPTAPSPPPPLTVPPQYLHTGLCKEDLFQALSQVTPSALREVIVEVPTVHWGDIGGMEAVKQSLKEVVEWPLLYASTFEALGLSCPKGVLLYGPPGCSKTLMAKAVATESAMNFLAVRGPELLSKYLGESEKAVQALFKRARAAAPSIIFFDEIDALASARGSSNTGVNDRVLSQLLVELDGSSGYGGGSKSRSRVIVIAATNRPDMLDPALMRPGRIDRKIYVSPPDELSRRQILESQLMRGKMSSRVRISEPLDELVALTEGFSGAEMVACCTEAAISVVNRVMERGIGCDGDGGDDGDAATGCADSNGFLVMDDMLQSVRAIKPQITQEMLQYYEGFAEENAI